MNKKNLFDVIGIILLFFGMSLAFLPHAIHISMGLKDENSHLAHIISGFTILLLGLGTLIFNKKFNKKKKFNN